MIAAQTRGTASADPLRVCTNSVPLTGLPSSVAVAASVEDSPATIVASAPAPGRDAGPVTDSGLDDNGELAAAPPWTDPLGEAVALCVWAQLDPRPPLVLAGSLAERGLANAGMDLSDGLSTDLADMCRQSGVGALIDAAAVPVSVPALELERLRERMGNLEDHLAYHAGWQAEVVAHRADPGREGPGQTQIARGRARAVVADDGPCTPIAWIGPSQARATPRSSSSGGE